MEFVKAFLVGGVICALVQILMDKTKLMPGRIMVMLVVTGTILGAVGLYEPFAEWGLSLIHIFRLFRTRVWNAAFYSGLWRTRITAVWWKLFVSLCL